MRDKNGDVDFLLNEIWEEIQSMPYKANELLNCHLGVYNGKYHIREYPSLVCSNCAGGSANFKATKEELEKLENIVQAIYGGKKLCNSDAGALINWYEKRIQKAREVILTAEDAKDMHDMALSALGFDDNGGGKPVPPIDISFLANYIKTEK